MDPTQLVVTDTIHLYTDGSSTGRVGEGGWGFVIVVDGKMIHEASGGALETTNNRMELMGAIEGLRYMCTAYPIETHIVVHSDSQYVIKGITEWYTKWEEKMSRGKQIKNQDLWVDYKQLVDLFPNVELKWIRGHSGDTYNDRCDYLAKQAKVQATL